MFATRLRTWDLRGLLVESQLVPHFWDDLTLSDYLTIKPLEFPMQTSDNITPFPDRCGSLGRARLATETSDLTLPHIVVHCKSQLCLGCKRTHRWSEVYECVTKGNMKELLPAPHVQDIPSDYEIVPMTLPTQHVVCCHECVGQHPYTDSAAHARWKETLRRKNEQATLTTEHAKGRVIPTLDQL